MSPSTFSSTLTIDAQISEARAYSEAEVDKMGEDEDDSDIDYDQEDNTAADDDMQESCDESDDDNDCIRNTMQDFAAGKNLHDIYHGWPQAIHGRYPEINRDSRFEGGHRPRIENQG